MSGYSGKDIENENLPHKKTKTEHKVPTHTQRKKIPPLPPTHMNKRETAVGRRGVGKGEQYEVSLAKVNSTLT